jgi:hypothetical protein
MLCSTKVRRVCEEVGPSLYKVGDLLAMESFDGRSTNWAFLEVASLKENGAPRVYFLSVLSEEVARDGISTRIRRRPRLGRRLPGTTTSLRWYPSRETYAFREVVGTAYTRLTLYDSEREYECLHYREK